MTTTHTFQGLNSDSKPSSRVLNPPGGSSSNIFGCDDHKQQTSARSIPESTSKNKIDALGHDLPAAGPQQKSWAPRSGGDSIHIPCGIYQSIVSDKAFSNTGASSCVSGMQNPRMYSVGRLFPRSKFSNADTFLDLFGEDTTEQRKIFRRVKNVNDESFSRIFGQTCIFDTKECKKVISHSSAINASNVGKSERCSLKSDASVNQIVNMNYSSSNVSLKKIKKEEKASAINQSLLKYMFPHSKKRAMLSRKFSPKSAFNPITGELYEQPRTKPESQLPSSVASEISKTLLVCNSTDTTDQVSASTPSTLCDTTQAVPAVTSTSQPKQQQSGIFGGGAEDAKEHTSTRVSQPPGGRSSKLW